VASEYGSSEGPRSGAQLSSFFILSLPTLVLSKTPEPLHKAWRITVDAGEKELPINNALFCSIRQVDGPALDQVLDDRNTPEKG
jgi:hypothetical protein